MTSNPGVVVGSIHYDIRSTDEDNTRRCTYFKNIASDTSKLLFDKDCPNSSLEAVLLDEEKRLLDDLRIDYDFQENHAYDLYEFFKTLPNCQTSTALSLNAGCNTAHYILFSILFEAERKAREEFEKLKTKPTSSHDFREFSNKAIDSLGRLIEHTPGVTPETREDAIAKHLRHEMRIPDDYNDNILALFTIEV